MWTLFYGEASDATALVYARWHGQEPFKSELTLTLRGPICDLARTLPTPFKMQLRGDGIWQTTVVDPCFWSPSLPARYQLLTAGDRKPMAELGIRRFGVKRNSLWLNGERWVLRATTIPKPNEERDWGAELSAVREAHLALILDAEWPQLQPLAEQASRAGVMLVVRLHDNQHLCATLQQIATWPAVAIGLLPVACAADPKSLRYAAPNVLLAADLTAPSAPEGGHARPIRAQPNGPSGVRADAIPTWLNLVVATNNKSTLQTLAAQLEHRALVAHCLLSSEASNTPNERRRACERLQAQLAPELDLAGYLVETE